MSDLRSITYCLLISGPNKRGLLSLLLAVILGVSATTLPTVAQARVAKLIVQSSVTAFDGYSFPGVGTYQVIKGYAIDAVNPKDPLNSVITDIQLAPRDNNGNVTVVFNFYILTPSDPSKGNGKMMYEPVNRGNKLFGFMNNTPSFPTPNDPASITDPAILASSFLWSRGYTTVWSGWEYEGDPTQVTTLNGSAAGLSANGTALMSMPVASNHRNIPLTGPGYEYIVQTMAANSYTLAYPAASSDQSTALLTHRVHLNDQPQVIPTTNWSFTDTTNTAIKLSQGPFIPQDIYEFSYVAKNPTVNGLGLAVIRDFNSFLRYSLTDDFGKLNPLAHSISRIYSYALSQPARALNDFVHLGFNEDEDHKKVFDGMLQWAGAANGLNMNYRWSQTNRTERNRQEKLYLEGLYPFANVPTYDPISRTSDWRYQKCERTQTCPLTLEFYSANEYWVKAASLMSTDPSGRFDLPDHPLSRLYMLSSAQHGIASDPTTQGACQQFLNPLDPAPVERALWVDLDEWVTRSVLPPQSTIPSLKNQTLAPSLPQSAVGFPNIPGVTYTGLASTRYRYDYGPNFYQNFIPTINPPIPPNPIQSNPSNGGIYPSYVPKTDGDGNDISGIRLPELQAPLATYTGWGLRSGVWANDGCEGFGQYIPFQATKEARIAARDPRPSIQERYASISIYQKRLIEAVNDLVRRRFLICDDTQAIISRLSAAGITAGLSPQQSLNQEAPVSACRGLVSPH